MTLSPDDQVAVATLQALPAVIGCLRERVVSGLNTLVPALAGAMGSANDKVRLEARSPPSCWGEA